MKKFHLLLALFAGFLLNTATAQIDTQYDFGEKFSVGEEERISLGKEDFSVMVAELIEDSRCPIGVNCIWEGQVIVKLTIQKKDKIYTKEIKMRGGRNSAIEVEGYVINLLEVRAKKMLGLKSYIYTLEVNKNIEE